MPVTSRRDTLLPLCGGSEGSQTVRPNAELLRHFSGTPWEPANVLTAGELILNSITGRGLMPIDKCPSRICRQASLENEATHSSRPIAPELMLSISREASCSVSIMRPRA